MGGRLGVAWESAVTCGERLGLALGLLVAGTGLFQLPATIHTPLYFPSLELHRWVGWSLGVAAPLALVVHVRRTGSSPWAPIAAVLLGGLLSLPVVDALDFPEPMPLLTLQRRALGFGGTGNPSTPRDGPELAVAPARSRASVGRPWRAS